MTMKRLKKKSPPSKAVKKAADEQAKAEEVYRARVKFERLIARCDAINAFHFTPLVTDPETVDNEGEGEFEPEELARVPSRQLYHSLLYLEETQERLDDLVGRVREALDARKD
jgi:hypothetical protein